MAKIFRISGYLVSDRNTTIKELKSYYDALYGEWWQQLHIEQSEDFELDGEDKQNCDLALLTRHFKKDSVNTNFDRPLPKAGERYKHFKIGKIVNIIGISRHTETEEVSVVYDYEGKIWNRPLDMFMSEVDKTKYPNATQKYRFELVEE